MWTIQSNNNKNRSSKYQTKIYSNYKQKLNINSLSVFGQFKANNKNRSSKYQPKYIQITNKYINSHTVCGQFKATTAKTDQVSIKPKYIQITNKNETLTNSLYVDNSKQQQQKQIK